MRMSFLNKNKKARLLSTLIALQFSFSLPAQSVVFAAEATDASIKSSVDDTQKEINNKISATSTSTTTDKADAAMQKIKDNYDKYSADNTINSNSNNVSYQTNAVTKADLISYTVADSNGNQVILQKNNCYNDKSSACMTYVTVKDSSGNERSVPLNSQQYIAADGSPVTTEMIKQATDQLKYQKGDSSGYLAQSIQGIAQMCASSNDHSGLGYLERAVIAMTAINQFKNAQTASDNVTLNNKDNKASQAETSALQKTESQISSGKLKTVWSGKISKFILSPAQPMLNESQDITLQFLPSTDGSYTLSTIDIIAQKTNGNEHSANALKVNDKMVLEKAAEITAGEKTVKAVLHYTNAQNQTKDSTVIIKYKVASTFISLAVDDKDGNLVETNASVSANVMNKELNSANNVKNIPVMGIIYNTEYAHLDSGDVCKMTVGDPDNNGPALVAVSSNIPEAQCTKGRLVKIPSAEWMKDDATGIDYLYDNNYNLNGTQTYDNLSDYWSDLKSMSTAYDNNSTYAPNIVEFEGTHVAQQAGKNLGTDYTVVNNVSIPINQAGKIGYKDKDLSAYEIAQLNDETGLDVTKLSAVKNDNGLYDLQDNSGKVVSNNDSRATTVILNNDVWNYTYAARHALTELLDVAAAAKNKAAQALNSTSSTTQQTNKNKLDENK